MILPDLLTNTSCELWCNGLTFKRKTGSGPDAPAFDWTITLGLTLDDQVVDNVPAYLAGAVEGLRRAAEGQGTQRFEFEPLDEARALRVSIDRGEDEVLNDAAGELRLVRVVATEGSPRFTARIKVFDLPASVAPALLECDQRPISLTVEPVQLSLAA